MKYLYPCNLRRVILLALCFVLAGSAPAPAQPVSKDHERASPAVMKLFRQVVAQPSESTVRIQCDGKNAALGAVVDANGLILTKHSLLSGEITCKLKDGREFTAEILGEQDKYDLALLKIPAKNLVPVKWRPAKELKQGMWLASVAPLAEPLAIGVVGVLPREGDQHIGPKTGYLGVGLAEDEDGARITSLAPGGPAAKAGLMADDVIIQAGSRIITNVTSLQGVVQSYRAGDEIILKVLRDLEIVEIKAKLGKHPQAISANPQDLMGSKLSDRRGGFPSILQHDTVILPRDCGGPVVDLDGRTVGINISRAGRTETYAIPSEAVLALLDDLKSGKLKKTEPMVSLPAPPPALQGVETFHAKGTLTDKDGLDKSRSKSFHHVHTVKLLAGAEYVINLQSGSFDAFLRLEDANGKQLEENDDAAGNFNARIVFRAPADGEYRIIVTTFNERETGDYTLTVRQTAAPKK